MYKFHTKYHNRHKLAHENVQHTTKQKSVKGFTYSRSFISERVANYTRSPVIKTLVSEWHRETECFLLDIICKYYDRIFYNDGEKSGVLNPGLVFEPVVEPRCVFS